MSQVAAQPLSAPPAASNLSDDDDKPLFAMLPAPPAPAPGPAPTPAPDPYASLTAPPALPPPPATKKRGRPSLAGRNAASLVNVRTF